MSERSGDNPLVIREARFLGDGRSRRMEAGEHAPGRLYLPAGRTVGKSSLLNRLVGRKRLARVSETPGRTREINFFRVNDLRSRRPPRLRLRARVENAAGGVATCSLEGYIAKTAARGCSTASGHAARAERTMTPRCSTFSRSWECRRSSFLPNRINPRARRRLSARSRYRARSSSTRSRRSRSAR